MRLIPASVSNQPLSQHRGTWVRPSHSEYKGTTAAPSGRIMMIKSVDPVFRGRLWTQLEWRTDCGPLKPHMGCYPFYNKEEVKMTVCECSWTRVKKNSQKSRGYVKMLGARKATRSKFHIEDPQIIGASKHNIEARATWRPGIVHFWRWMQKPDLYSDGILTHRNIGRTSQFARRLCWKW
jgi:hypothetical protein